MQYVQIITQMEIEIIIRNNNIWTRFEECFFCRLKRCHEYQNKAFLKISIILSKDAALEAQKLCDKFVS